MTTRLKILGLTLLTVLVTLTAQASAACSATSRATALYTGSGSVCVCDSTYIGATCDTQATLCKDILPDPNSVDVANTDILATAIVGNSVDVLLQLPMAASRQYTSVRMGNCTEDYFTTFQITTNTTNACMDQWHLGIPVSFLGTYCSFDVANDVQIGDSLYQQFSGILYVDYSETVAVDSLISTTRINTISMPVTFELASDYQTDLTFTNVNVVGYNNLLSAAITGQNITSGATTSWAMITYKIGFPYQVIHMDPNLNQVDGNSQISGALYYPNGDVLTSDTYNNAPNCTGTTANSGDYTTLTFMCTKTVYVVFTHGDHCRLNGTYEITGLAVKCGTNVADTDCPLTTSVPASISFTVISENFCPDAAVPNIINNVITIDQFVAPDPQYLKYDTQSVYNNGSSRPRQWNTLFFMRAHFTGLTVYACQARTVETDWFSDGYDTVYSTASQVLAAGMMTGDIPQGYGTGSKPASGKLGLDIENQAFLLMHVLDTSFAAGNDAVNLTATNGPKRGMALTLRVRVTLDVRYDSEAAQGRRRRRNSRMQNSNNDGAGDLSERQLPSIPRGSVAMGLEPQTIVPYGDVYDDIYADMGARAGQEGQQGASGSNPHENSASSMMPARALGVIYAAIPFFLSLALGVF